jgi:hypothetical protein
MQDLLQILLLRVEVGVELLVPLLPLINPGEVVGVAHMRPPLPVPEDQDKEIQGVWDF